MYFQKMALRLKYKCTSNVHEYVSVCIFVPVQHTFTSKYKGAAMVVQKCFYFTCNTPMGIKLQSIKITCKHVFPTYSFFGFVFYCLLREMVRREVIDISDPIKRVQFINKILEKDETQQPVGMGKFYNSVVTNHSKSQLTAV